MFVALKNTLKFDEIVFLPCFYTEKPIIKLTSFSQYTTICFVSFSYSVFNEQFSQPCFASLSVFCYAKYCFTFKPHGIKAYARVILVGPSGLEPPTSCLSGTRSNLLSYDPMWYLAEVVLTLDLPCGGDDGIRTHDPLLAGQVLSQLSYTPIF